MLLDPTTKTILRCIAALGFAVTLQPSEELTTITAVKDGETFEASHSDDYKAACQLAEKVGIDLMDG